MGQIIKRPFQSFNGTDWDKHYFETSADMVKDLNRSITFGRSSKQVVSGNYGTINFDKIFTDRGSDTSLATLSGGNIKVLKAGTYLMTTHARYHCTEIPKGVREELYINSTLQVLSIAGGSHSTDASGNTAGVFKLNANDIIKLIFNGDDTGSSLQVDFIEISLILLK